MDYEETVYNFQRAQSALEQSKAALAKAERNLSYATITSPIDGVVTSRDVEEGQTVASRFRNSDTVHHRCRLDQDAGGGRCG